MMRLKTGTLNPNANASSTAKYDTNTERFDLSTSAAPATTLDATLTTRNPTRTLCTIWSACSSSPSNQMLRETGTKGEGTYHEDRTKFGDIEEEAETPGQGLFAEPAHISITSFFLSTHALRLTSGNTATAKVNTKNLDAVPLDPVLAQSALESTPLEPMSISGSPGGASPTKR